MLVLHKNFFCLWIFHLLSIFGSELIRFAFPIWLFQKEGNLVSFSVFVCCGLIPRIFSPISGGFIDCCNKKKLLITSELSLVLISLTIGSITSGFINPNFAFICFLIFSIGIFSNLVHLATLSMLPQIVKKDDLLKANSLMRGAESSAVLLCPLLTGSFISMFGISKIVLLNMLLFIVLLLFLIPVKTLIDNKISKNLSFVLIDVKERLIKGACFIKKDRKFIFLLIVSGLINFVFSFSFVPLFTPMILSSSQNNTQLLGIIQAIGSGAQIFTSFLVGYFFKSQFYISMMIKCVILLGLCGPFLIGIGSTPIFWTIGYGITLALLSIINSTNHAFWQTYTPLNLQATLSGIRTMITAAIAPIGSLLTGPVIAFLEVSSKLSFIGNPYQLVFLTAGILMIFIGIVAASLKIFKHSGALNVQNE